MAENKGLEDLTGTTQEYRNLNSTTLYDEQKAMLLGELSHNLTLEELSNLVAMARKMKDKKWRELT